MFKKPFYFFCAITLLLSSASVSLAQWSQLTPEIVGGTLSARCLMDIALINENTMIMFGGYNNGYLNDTWQYNINENRWKNLSPTVLGGTLTARQAPSYCYIGGDQILMFGGHNGSAGLNDTWLYDLSDNSWTKLAPSVVGGTLGIRQGAPLCNIGGGRALMFGGHNGSSYLNETWMFNLNNNTWTKLAPTVTGGSLSVRYHPGLAYSGNNKVLLFGGTDNTTYFNDTWIYNISTNVWTKQTPSFVGGTLTVLAGQKIVSVEENKAIMFGGRYTSTSYANETWLYDFTNNQWSKLNMAGTNGVPGARAFPGFCNITTNKMILFGGYDGTSKNDTWLIRIPDQGADTIQHENLPTGVKLTWSWNLPADFTGITFFVYKNGQKISPAISQGTVDGDAITFSYTDQTITSGTIGKYKISEVNSYTGIETMYPKEIVVPYCQ